MVAVLGRHELVAHTVDGANEEGAAGIAFDLLPKFGNAVINRAVSSALAPGPCRSNEFLARDNDAGMPHKKLQNLKFPQGQFERLVSAAEFHPLKIQRKISKARHLKLRCQFKVVHAQDGDSRIYLG